MFRSKHLINAKRHHQIFSSFSEQLQGSRTLDECWEAYRKLMENFGFIEMFYGLDMASKKTEYVGNIESLISTYRNEFLSELLKPYYLKNDYTIYWCENSERVLNWSNVELEDITRGQLDVAVLSWDFKIVNGLSVPLRIDGHTNSWGGVGLSATGMEDDEFNVVLKEYGELVCRLTYLFHQRVQSLPFLLKHKGTYDRMIELTPEEKDCLLYSSCGYQISEIADKLNKKKRTVELYMKNAREKLNAKTTTHAISKAILLGYLD